MSNEATECVTDVWHAIRQAVIPAIRDYRSNLKSLNVEVKADQTFLTEADTNIQRTIIDEIRRRDPVTPIVAEEVYNSFLDKSESAMVADSTADAWIIDPIDGTSQFIRPHGREFCTAVALLKGGMPSMALVIAHEASQGREPICIFANVEAGIVEVDDELVPQDILDGSPTGWASVGQDGRRIGPEVGEYLTSRGYQLKTSTTSQTLDVLRASGGILPPSGFPPFDVFYREFQKVWDGIPGMCVAMAAGKAVGTLHTDAHLPLDRRFLRDIEPKFRSTIIGRTDLVEEMTRSVSFSARGEGRV